jgi:hypothetical protein
LEPSTSLWARRVFDSRSTPQPVVSWPRPVQPVTDDLTHGYVDVEPAGPASGD